jgi:hypothetical protein
MGHLLPVHEAHQLAHEPFYPKSLIPPRCPCAQPSIIPRCAGRTCVQHHPAGPAPRPLHLPPLRHPSGLLLPATAASARAAATSPAHAVAAALAPAVATPSCVAPLPPPHVASSPLLAPSSPLVAPHRLLCSPYSKN